MNSPWYSLDTKSIWVTGGAGHLGSAITTALDRHCREVVCFDLGERADALVRQAGLTRTTPRTLDVSDTSGLPDGVEAAIASHGVPDGLVHLAFASSAGTRLEELSAAEFDRTLTRSLTPTFALCRLLAERMKSRRSGSFVLFGSMYGIIAPDPRVYPPSMAPNPIDYGSSKAAVLQLSRYLAMHYGPAGIRFNCVIPGAFPNPTVQRGAPGFVTSLAARTPLGRTGDRDEIVGPTLFLLTDSSSYMTGQGLVVDGGWTIW